MIWQRTFRSALLSPLLALVLLAGLALAAPAQTNSAPASGAARPETRSLGRSVPTPAVSDSARQAYRAWITRLRARARAESIARADSAARGVTPAAVAPAGSAADSAAADSLAAAAAAPPHDYVAEVRANFTAENRAYSTTRTVLAFGGVLYGILLGLFLLFSGLSAWLRDLAHRLSKRAYVRVLLYVIFYSVAAFLLSFPLTFYEGFALEHQYKLSNQGFGGWFFEQGLGLLVGIIFTGVVPLVQLVFWTIRRFPRGWWAWLGLGTLPFLVVTMVIQPIFIAPLFNKYTPLQDKQLEAKILDVAHRVGIPARHVFQVDASRQTEKYNAYVSGFGPSQRLVLYDTILKGLTTDEILIVVGHEAAHYRLGHIWKLLIAMSLASFLIFWLCSVSMRWAVARWGGRWGFNDPGDIASLPLFVVAITLFSFLAGPIGNVYSRQLERDSDTYSLEVTHLNDAAARVFIKLGSQNRSDPEPSRLIEIIQYSHPPLLQRVRFALDYRPWEQGRPNRLYKPRG